MARAIWSGSISFGLLNVPVKMYSAVQEHRLHFRYVHETDGSPIGYAKFCKAEDRPVPDSEIVKAFDYEGEMIPMRDEDFETAAAEESHRSIDIRDFVQISEIDPIYFERTYFLAADEGAEKPYALLTRAMQECGSAAIAKIVMRDRQHLACLRASDGVLVLERMHFADEVRPAAEHRPDAGEPEERQLEMARSLIGELAADFDPGQYEDSYRDALCEIIESKREGEAIEPPPEPEEEERAPDLMSALEASLAEIKGNGAGRSDGDSGNGGRDLGKLSKGELYEMAKRADVAGRSEMSKEELAAALSG